MKFGLFYELQLPTPWQEGDENRIFRDALEHLVLGEKLGFEYVWAVEHHFLDDHSLSSSPNTWLSAAAALTSRIRLGHGISCVPPNFVHPARVAEHIATLDQISNGRVEFGTGESTSRMELEGFGVDPQTKRRAWQEAVGQITDMMVMKPYPGFEGEFFSMPCRNVIPKPFQKPHPPLWVAGKPDLAAQNGMGCLGFNVLSLPMAKAAVDTYYSTLADSCVPIGHAVNANIAMLTHMHVNHDATLAAERARHIEFFGYSAAEYYVMGEVRPGRSASWPIFEARFDQVKTLHDNSTSAIGDPVRVREHLRGLEHAGVDQVFFLHQGGHMLHEWNCESLELFALEVMPEFVERDEDREKDKQKRMEPLIEAALARKQWRRELEDEEIPVVVPYGKLSTAPIDEHGGILDVTTDTIGALGITGERLGITGQS
jgi:alkanesulfonate monooxygenase SsuD/methylene tetrahydromethanopterin reductase-like flavin-dependent oxidoreductase (luciferase family)